LVTENPNLSILNNVGPNFWTFRFSRGLALKFFNSCLDSFNEIIIVLKKRFAQRIEWLQYGDVNFFQFMLIFRHFYRSKVHMICNIYRSLFLHFCSLAHIFHQVSKVHRLFSYFFIIYCNLELIINFV
jgi:hypothetical protein